MELVPHLLYEPEESGILWIKFNRPERMNAVAPDTTQKVVEYLLAGDQDPNIRVMVLTGVGRAFCAGADLKSGRVGTSTEQGPDATRQSFAERGHPQFKQIAWVRKPTIAMVNGPAAGAGFDMALQCDLRTGCETTRFFTYANAGNIIENGGSYYLPRMAGLGRALELCFTGGWLQGEEAYRWGILNRYVPSNELEAATRELCDQIIKTPPMIQWAGKRIIRMSLDCSYDATQDLCANVSHTMFASEDSKEAMQSWAQKRAPVFKGR